MALVLVAAHETEESKGARGNIVIRRKSNAAVNATDLASGQNARLGHHNADVTRHERAALTLGRETLAAGAVHVEA